MKILIDAHMVGEHETGNETYVVNLIRGLQALKPDAQILVSAASVSLLQEKLPTLDGLQVVTVSASPVRRLLVDLPRIVKEEQVDLLHVTYMAPLRVRCRLVVSVHDVAFRRNPKWFSLRDLAVLRTGVGLTVRKADRVLTLSNHANSEIRSLYGLASEKVTTVYLAAGEEFKPVPDVKTWAGFKEYDINRPYVLAVGNLQPRKNLPRLIEAFARVKRAKQLPHKLVLIGKALWRETEVYRAIEKAGLADEVVCTGYVPDEDLPRVYAGADCFVYPSLYEGFGLPVLEAMASGTAVITSTATSLPEVAGDAALLVDPHSVDAIADALGSLLEDAGQRAALAERGRVNAQRFSWKQTAAETFAVYKAVLG